MMKSYGPAFAAFLFAILLGMMYMTERTQVESLKQDNAILVMQKAELQRQIQIQQAKIDQNALYWQQYELNEKIILLEDSHNFIAQGILTLQDFRIHEHNRYQQIKDDQVVGVAEETIYQLIGDPGIFHGGVWYPFDVEVGQTVHLYTWEDVDGNITIHYYTCFTNNTHCEMQDYNTGIQIN